MKSDKRVVAWRKGGESLLHQIREHFVVKCIDSGDEKAYATGPQAYVPEPSWSEAGIAAAVAEIEGGSA